MASSDDVTIIDVERKMNENDAEDKTDGVNEFVVN